MRFQTPNHKRLIAASATLGLLGAIAAPVAAAADPRQAPSRADGTEREVQYSAIFQPNFIQLSGTSAVTRPDTAWGNQCASNIANDTGSPMYWQSESNWPTDTWQEDPANTYIDTNGSGGSGWDLGGFMRGCHFEVNWVLNDAVTIEIQNTDPWTGSNSFSCSASVQSKYQCTLESSSVIHGPILRTNWTINKIDWR